MKTNSDTTRRLYLGLDVHKEQTVIAILEGTRDAEPRQYGSVTTSQHALARAVRRIAKSQGRDLSDLHVCYEASGCGFWIARRLLQMGVRCDVIAPSLIPTRSGDRVKTDKRDAAKLARSLRSNDLVAVHVPDALDEAIRDLCRARTDAVDDLRRAKTRLLALLRRLGYRYDGKPQPQRALEDEPQLIRAARLRPSPYGLRFAPSMKPRPPASLHRASGDDRRVVARPRGSRPCEAMGRHSLSKRAERLAEDSMTNWNRLVRTRMPGGVGGGGWNAPPTRFWNIA